MIIKVKVYTFHVLQQMHIPSQPQLQLPDPLTLDPHSLLIGAGEALGQTLTGVSDIIQPITFQQDANGAIIPKIEPGVLPQPVSSVDISGG